MTTIYTVGHGNRGLEDFIELLRAAGIQCLVDVRAYPRSRCNPRFTRTILDPVLTARGIRYVWEGKALGGMRQPRADSLNTALTDAAYRGFADHMASAEFQDAAQRLLALGGGHLTACMCAETDQRHCRRSFIADALIARGARVCRTWSGPGTFVNTRRAQAPAWWAGIWYTTRACSLGLRCDRALEIMQ